MAQDAERNPVLITEAEPSLDDQHRQRVRKYLTLMAFRVPALIVGGLVYGATGSGWWALAVVAGSIPIPWIAVLIANDRPPRRKGEVQVYKYAPAPQRQYGLAGSSDRDVIYTDLPGSTSGPDADEPRPHSDGRSGDDRATEF